MKKYYCLPVVFLAGSTFLTGCHSLPLPTSTSSTATTVATSSLTPAQEHQIKTINKRITKLTKQLYTVLDKLSNNLDKMNNTTIQWSVDINKKYPTPRGGYTVNDHSAGRKQKDIYQDAIYNLNSYGTPHSVNTYAEGELNNFLASELVYFPLKNGTYFLYNPSKGQDKVEVLLRIQGLTEKLVNVQTVIHQGLSFDYSQVDPDWQGLITTIRHKLTHAEHEATTARKDLTAIKSYVITIPES